VVSGAFDSLDGVSRFGLVRLNRWGRPDATFTGGAGLQIVRTSSPTGFATIGASSMAPLPNGSLATAGSFSHVNESATATPVILTAGPFSADPVPPPTLEVETGRSPHLTIRWPRAAMQTGYLLERTTDDGGSWREIARLPASWSHYVDTDIQVGQVASYRIRGISGKRISESTSPVASGTATSPFALWLASSGLDPSLSPDLDLDHDGWSLFLEYGLDGHPEQVEASSWLRHDHSTAALTIATPRPDLFYTLDQSADGTTWTVRLQQVGGPGRTLELFPDPAPGGATLLLRVRLEPAP